MEVKHVIITIHGIKTKLKNDWQNTFGVYVMKKTQDVVVLPFRYGYLFAISSWFTALQDKFNISSWKRKRIVKKLDKLVQKVREEYPDASISLIGHSFGGWVINKYLQEEDYLKLENIVFVHSPISSHIESTNIWSMLALHQIKSVHAWSSQEDMIIGKVARKPFGQNGFWGFIRYGFDEDREKPSPKPYPIHLYNHHTEEDHGGVLGNLDKYGEKLISMLTGGSRWD